MPKHNKKSQIIEFKVNAAILKVGFIEDIVHPDHCQVAIDEKMDELLEDIATISCFRRGDEDHVPKSLNWRDNILCRFDNARFMQMLHVDKCQFVRLIAIVLYRLGLSGSNASVQKITTTFGIGDDGTLAKITERVFSAILKKLPQYICWPDATDYSFHETLSSML